MKYIFPLILSLFAMMGYSQTTVQKTDILSYLNGPEFKGPAGDGYWEITCSLPIFVTSNGDCTIQNVDIYGKEDAFALIEFDLWSGSNSKLHDLTLSVWDKYKIYPISLYFDNGQSLNLNFQLKNCLNPDFRNSAAGYIRFTQQGSKDLNTMEKSWVLLLNNNITKLIVDGEVINFDNFTYSKFLFNTLLKQYATKVKSGDAILKRYLK